jgi:hypothetical protein
MAPQRDPKYLAFVRTQPCSVPGCRIMRFVEAHHTGLHGMAQKADDNSAIPLCRRHHAELHCSGVRSFIWTHKLDIPAIVAQLNEDYVVTRTGVQS